SQSPSTVKQPTHLCERCGGNFGAPRCSSCLLTHQTVGRLWAADFRLEAKWLADWIQRHTNDNLSVTQPVTKAELDQELRLPSPLLVDMRLVYKGKVSPSYPAPQG